MVKATKEKRKQKGKWGLTFYTGDQRHKGTSDQSPQETRGVLGEMGEGDHRCKLPVINKSWGMMTTIYNTVLCIYKLLKE